MTSSVLSLLLSANAAGAEPHLGHLLPLWSVLPFGLMLLAIALYVVAAATMRAPLAGERR